jgi:hypothetical protein
LVREHLAGLYEVSTKRLNEQVKRNAERFPFEFAFRLSKKEIENLKSQSATSSSHGGRRTLPDGFTEHGLLMAANVLKSTRAVAVSVALIKAFIRVREVMATNQAMGETSGRSRKDPGAA